MRVFLAGLLAASALSGAAQAETVIIHAGRVITDAAKPATGPSTITVTDGKIVSLVDGFADAPAGARVVELRDKTVLPGLIDMHVHLESNPGGDYRDEAVMTDDYAALVGAHNALTTVKAGFTTVRNVGAYIEGADLAQRDAIARGDYPGPRMQVSGPYLTIPGGGGDLLVPGVPEAEIPARVRAGVARGPEQFRARAERALASGADLLKVIASGAVLAFGGVPGAPEMSPAELRAVVEVARAQGKRVAAHAHGAQSIREAILAGASTIEHASLIDAEGIRLARERGVALAMDVYNGDYIDREGRAQGWPDEFLRKNLETTEIQRENFTRALRAGATIVFATDAGVFPHGLNARQFRVMVARGMTPLQAIQSATSVAARAMGWEDRVGAIEPGRYGDVLAVRGDPLRDIALLERVDVVVLGGVPQRGRQ